MSEKPFSQELFNFFKFSTLVLVEIPKVLRRIFITMWNSKIAIRPGFITWDDSAKVRNMLLKSECGKTDIPTTKSVEEWDCTALFEATIYAKTFGDPSCKGSTLNDMYLKEIKLAPGSFHSSVQSSTGNQDETYALAIDQLRLLRNTFYNSPKLEIIKTDFDSYVQLVTNVLTAVNVDTAIVDVISEMSEDDFPKEKISELVHCFVKAIKQQADEIHTMAEKPFSKEELNFLKISTLVSFEFPKVLRQIFITMWNSKVATRPGFITWDDSTMVRNMFLRSEGGSRTLLPTAISIEEWDFTALCQATIYAKTFGNPSGRRSTLFDLYLRKYHPGSFHSSVQSSTGNQDETYALAIDQLRLVRNTICHSPKAEIIETDFDNYLKLITNALTAVNADTAIVDAIGQMSEDDFPTEKVREKDDCRVKAMKQPTDETPTMAEKLFSKEKLNFLMFSTVVLFEFPKVMRQIFITMWNSKVAIRPGFIGWDDSTKVRNMLLASEGGKTGIQTRISIEKWPCTALFKATIFTRTFGNPSSRRSTLFHLYLSKTRLAPGSFHSSVQSSTGNQDETYALAINQLRLLRNTIYHSPKPEMSEADFDNCVQLVTDVLTALNLDTSFVDGIGRVSEVDFPTKKVQELDEHDVKTMKQRTGETHTMMKNSNLKEEENILDSLPLEKPEEISKNEKIIDARSLGLRFMSENPCCIRAIPYENGSEDTQSLTMYLYVDTDGKRIPKHVEYAAEEMFADYNIEFDDLQRRPLSKTVTRLPSSRKQKDKELSDLSRTIEKNLHVFENRLNVTAVQASYKVVNSIEQDIPCVTVFVLGKGRVPAGETDIKGIKELNGCPFDVAEGYYQPAYGPSRESYTFPLQGGVGIGVQGVHGAGTLGGFLEDEDGKFYILSNQHVLHPPEVENSTNEIIIVQPAELDYDTTLKDANSNLEVLQSKKSQIPGIPEDILPVGLTQEEKDSMIQEVCGHHVKQIEEKITQAENILMTIRDKKPRSIAKYVCGLQDNVEVSLGGNTRKIFVDAAIAELNEKEVLHMKIDKLAVDETNRCPLYGFEKNKGISPNGETADLEYSVKQLRTRDSELSFMKIGRTTGLTDEGIIGTEKLFVNCISASSDDTCASALFNIKLRYCNGCRQSGSRESEILQKENIGTCAKCHKKLNEDRVGSVVKSFWARNCFLIRKRRGKVFCDRGDSGALVFGDDNRAWGLLFGVFTDLSSDFCLASPLSVTLKALEKVSGKKELNLWCVKESQK